MYYNLLEVVLLGNNDVYLGYILTAVFVFFGVFGANYAYSYFYPSANHQVIGNNQITVADMNGDGHPDILLKNDEGLVIGINNGTLNDTGYEKVPDINFYTWNKSRYGLS